MLTQTISFGAEYVPGLSWESNTPGHVLERLETLVTIKWLAVTHKYVGTAKRPTSALPPLRMKLIVAKIPIMLHPDNPFYDIPIALPELNKESTDSPLGFFSVEPIKTLAVYSMMGLRAPSNMWSNLPGFSYRTFLKINGSGHGHIFRVKSKFCSSVRVFGSYEPPGVKGVLYLFFPTLGEYFSTDVDFYRNGFDRIEHAAIGKNISSYRFSCDIRRFVFE
ncbi:hypothetical protein [Candidatus Sororendozoicomonas aggregata]|uniref:hypothetical protein n=1 Tax=Candidatus Sororendozoicomonas aggregata TaxID=3073239 RepID=UPI002ED47673